MFAGAIEAVVLLATFTADGGEPAVLALEAPLYGADLVAWTADAPRRLAVGREAGLELLDWRDGRRAGAFPRGDSHLFAWCVAEAGGGIERIVVLKDGGEVWTFGDGDRDPRLVVTDPAVNLPGGVYALAFARDLNGDGVFDLVLPTKDGLNLYWNLEGALRRGPSVRHEIDVDVDADGPNDADPTLRQRISIPRFDVVDQNGDGVPDLMFADGEHVQFYWSSARGELPESPTFELDLDEIRASLPPRSRDLIDTGNLFSILDSRVSFVARDLDGDGFDDLLLRRGSKVSIYRGAAGGVDRSQATQVLKTGGNLLAAFALDDDGDGRDDLCMLRVSDVSLGQVLLWLVAGGTLSFDLFVYRQEEPLSFSRKPWRQRTLEIDLPSVASLIGGDLEDRFESLSEDVSRGPVRADFDGDGERDDVARVAAEGGIDLYRDVALASDGEEFPLSAWKDLIRRFDVDAGGGEVHEVELVDMIDWAPLPGRDLARRVREIPVSRHIDLGEVEGESILYAVDLDRRGGTDLIHVAHTGSDDPVRLTFFLTPLRAK